MLRQSMFAALAATAAMLGLYSAGAWAFDGYVEVTNDTGYTIYYLYVSHTSSGGWEEDVLGSEVLMDGETVRVDIENANSEFFDIRAVDEDDDSYTLWNVDISRRNVTFTLADLDGVGSSFDGYVRVTNDTGYDFHYLYVSNAESDSWEEDVLGKGLLLDGQTVRVDVTNAESEYFDIRAVDEDGDSYTLWDVDISSRDITFTLANLD
jgi:predicted RNA-binding protein